jgi:hypothetical protein
MRKLKISRQRVTVVAYFHEEGSVLRGDKRGEVDRIQVEVSFDTEEPDEVIREALALTHRMCFTESVITRAVPVETTHVINERPF